MPVLGGGGVVKVSTTTIYLPYSVCKPYPYLVEGESGKVSDYMKYIDG